MVISEGQVHLWHHISGCVGLAVQPVVGGVGGGEVRECLVTPPDEVSLWRSKFVWCKLLAEREVRGASDWRRLDQALSTSLAPLVSFVR